VAVTAVPTEPLSGPWLMLPGPDGLWAYDLASGELNLVETRHLLAPQDITAMPAPAGGLVAYITGENGIDQLTLNILRLPRAQAQTVSLVAPEFEPATSTQPGEPAAEALRALFEVTSLAWSPDGRLLAFTGLLEGPTADLYLLPVARGDVPTGPGPTVRLTDDPAQATQPFWSPDGQTIIYAGLEDFGMGAGYTMTNVWAARADGSGVRTLYDASASGGEFFLGWLDETTLLVHSWGPNCGNERLRTINVETGTQAPVWDGPFNGAAFDPSGGRVLISIDRFTSQCEGAAAQGLYLLPGPGKERARLLQDEAFLPVWDGTANLFFARTPSAVFSVDLGGSVLQLQAPEPLLPAASRGGDLAWASPLSGLWVAHLGSEARQIYAQPASTPAWSPGGDALFFFAEAGFFRASAPDFTPELIREGLTGAGAFWLNP